MCKTLIDGHELECKCSTCSGEKDLIGKALLDGLRCGVGISPECSGVLTPEWGPCAYCALWLRADGTSSQLRGIM